MILRKRGDHDDCYCNYRDQKRFLELPRAEARQLKIGHIGNDCTAVKPQEIRNIQPINHLNFDCQLIYSIENNL